MKGDFKLHPHVHRLLVNLINPAIHHKDKPCIIVCLDDFRGHDLVNI